MRRRAAEARANVSGETVRAFSANTFKSAHYVARQRRRAEAEEILDLSAGDKDGAARRESDDHGEQRQEASMAAVPRPVTPKMMRMTPAIMVQIRSSLKP